MALLLVVEKALQVEEFVTTLKAVSALPKVEFRQAKIYMEGLNLESLQFVKALPLLMKMNRPSLRVNNSSNLANSKPKNYVRNSERIRTVQYLKEMPSQQQRKA